MRYEEIKLDLKPYGYETQATLTAYIPDKIEKKGAYTKPNIIVCPGGGYEVLWETEREAVALRYLAEGFNVFLLNYSVLPTEYPVQLLELAAAVRYVRQQMDCISGDAEKVVLCGFSAGAHLAANLGTCWNKGHLKKIIGSGHQHKPDAMILSYPPITTEDDQLKEFFGRFTGYRNDSVVLEEISLEKQADSDTIPAFLWCSGEDFLTRHVLLFALKLHEHRVPFECFVYQKGTHGLSLANDVTSFESGQNLPHCADWVEKSVEWVKDL